MQVRWVAPVGVALVGVAPVGVCPRSSGLFWIFYTGCMGLARSLSGVVPLGVPLGSFAIVFNKK